MQSLKSSIVVDALPVCIREAYSGTAEVIIIRVGTIILNNSTLAGTPSEKLERKYSELSNFH